MFNRRSLLLPFALLVALSGGPVACSDCNLSVNTTFLPDGFVGVYYSAGLNSACGGDAWVLQTGDLPPGINLQENGFMQGFPTRAGSFIFTVAVVPSIQHLAKLTPSASSSVIRCRRNSDGNTGGGVTP